MITPQSFGGGSFPPPPFSLTKMEIESMRQVKSVRLEVYPDAPAALGGVQINVQMLDKDANVIAAEIGYADVTILKEAIEKWETQFQAVLNRSKA